VAPKGIKEQERPPRALERTPIPDHRPEGLSGQVWYCAASILGAMFAYVLAPLIVEFMKHRMGFGRHQHDWGKQVQKGEAHGPVRREPVA
jgi:hypothetical protein